MRPTGIAIIGFVSLLVVFVFVAYVQLILLCLALIVCLLIVGGFVREGHKPRTFWIATARKSAEDVKTPPQDARIKIEGRSFSIQALPTRLEFTIHWRNLHLLIAIAFIAICAAVACLMEPELLTQRIEPASTRYFEFYLLCYFMVVLLFPSLAWLSECALMRAPGITLANVGVRGFRIVYRFTDPRGGYYGGSTMNLGGSKDDQLKVVFCNPRNPGFNKPSCGLLFHKVEWANEPSASIAPKP